MSIGLGNFGKGEGYPPPGENVFAWAAEYVLFGVEPEPLDMEAKVLDDVGAEIRQAAAQR